MPISGRLKTADTGLLFPKDEPQTRTCLVPLRHESGQGSPWRATDRAPPCRSSARSSNVLPTHRFQMSLVCGSSAVFDDWFAAVARGQSVEVSLAAQFVDQLENAALSNGATHRYKNQSTKVLAVSRAAEDRAADPSYKWYERRKLNSSNCLPLVEKTTFSGRIAW